MDDRELNRILRARHRRWFLAEVCRDQRPESFSVWGFAHNARARHGRSLGLSPDRTARELITAGLLESDRYAVAVKLVDGALSAAQIQRVVADDDREVGDLADRLVARLAEQHAQLMESVDRLEMAVTIAHDRRDPISLDRAGAALDQLLSVGGEMREVLTTVRTQVSVPIVR